jgi:hypothetical protein
MTHDTIELLIGITWLLWMAGFLWFMQGLIKLAREIDGPIVQWPVPGRWLMVGLLGGLALICADIVRLRFEPAFLEPYWTSEGPDAASTEIVLAIRAVPLIFLFWVAWRVKHGGLIRGRKTSTPIPGDNPPVERRQELRRQDDILAYAAKAELQKLKGN